jgi:hypothetical protein
MQSLRIRIALIVGGLLAPVIFLDLLPWLRGPQGWRWPLATLPPWPNLLLSGGTAVLFLLGWWWLRHRAVRQTQLAMGILFILSLLLQASLLNLTPTTNGQYHPVALLFERLASAQASGYFTAAQEIDHLPTALRDYPQLMPAFGADPHPRSKPPGIVLLYYGTEQIMARLPALSDPLGQWARGIRCADMWLATRSNAALASNLLVSVLTPLLAALIIWPAYGFTARQFGHQAAWLAAGLAALLPGRLAFAPHMDTVYPLLTLLALSLADQGIQRRDWRFGLLSGLVISLATYFSLVNALIAPLVGLFVLAKLARERQSFWRMAVVQGMAISAGAMGIWLVYWLISEVTPLAIYHAAAPARHDLARNYWVWLLWNVVDFALFASVSAFLLALPRPRELRHWLTANALLPAFWLTFVALTVSGMIRGEVGRIWLVLAGAPLLLAVREWDNGRLGERAGLWLLVVVAAVSWAINVRWETSTLEWLPEAPRLPVTTIPSPTHLLDATFGSDISLIGYELATGEELDLTLIWQAQARPEVPYTVFIHVVDETGTIVAQRDVMPDNGRLPTTCWQPEEIITDAHHLPLAGLQAGNYYLRMGLYNQATGERLGEPVILTTLQR